MIRNIPISKLKLSVRNVRRACDPAADLELKADIASHGLLQNLVVTPSRKPRGFFSVEAGGRRLKALQGLVEEGKDGPGHGVCCLVIDRRSDAEEVSLAENFQRLAMNPADECLAFRQLVENGVDVEGIARRFGLTPRFVEGRLRLADLAPEIFEALGAGQISLEIAKAYAATPDRERQAYVFEQMRGCYGPSNPDSIRRMMTQATAAATDRRARFVGEEAYVAAGGRIERDLFADDAATRWLDIALLERLAAEKLEAIAPSVAADAGLGWVRPTLDTWVGSGETSGLRRLPIERPPLNDEEAASVAALEAEIEDVESLLEIEEDQAARTAAEARLAEISDRIGAIVNKPPIFDDQLKPQVGAFLMLDDQGRPRLDTTFYVDAPIAQGQDEGEGSSVGDEDRDELVVDKPRGQGLSQRLVDELAMQRRDVLAVHLAADPVLAHDLAIFLMVDRDPSYGRDRSGSSLVVRTPSDPVTGFETPNAPATFARLQASDALDRTWMEGESRSARFDAFRALPEPDRASWLGHAVACTLEASLNLAGQRFCAFHDHLGQLLEVDVASWWRPTGINFFDRVPKAVALAALAEVGGPVLAGRYSGSKKAELAQACERIFAGEAITEPEIREAALAWVPEVMRFASSVEAEPEPDEAPGTAGEEEPDPEVEPEEAVRDPVLEAA